jgi:hypothetical protein
MKRRLTLVWMAAVAIAALVGAGSAQARLDPSFGEGGILHLTAPPVASGSTNYLRGAYVGRGGEYFAFYRQDCRPGLNQCPNGSYLYRYLPNATVDPAFAGGQGFLSPEGGPGPAYGATTPFALDSSGRPIYATPVGGEGGNALIVRRVQLSGVADAGFGAGGVARVPCPYSCGKVGILPRPDGSTLVTVAGQYPGGQGPAQPAVDVYALNAKGFPIRKFSTTAELHLSDLRAIDNQALTPGGGVYLAGGYGLGPVTESTPVNELRRISANGKLDTKFGTTAANSLLPLLELNGEGAEIRTLLIGPTGKVELFGAIGKYNGFQLRLLPSGKTDRSFGKNGLRKYQFVPRQVVAGSHGGTMVLATESDFTNRLYRVLANGRVDSAFGAQGEEIPGADGEPEESGISLFRAGKGRVAVVDRDLRYCRQVCPEEPRMFRFLEGK